MMAARSPRSFSRVPGSARYATIFITAKTRRGATRTSRSAVIGRTTACSKASLIPRRVIRKPLLGQSIYPRVMASSSAATMSTAIPEPLRQRCSRWGSWTHPSRRARAARASATLAATSRSRSSVVRHDISKKQRRAEAPSRTILSSGQTFARSRRALISSGRNGITPNAGPRFRLPPRGPWVRPAREAQCKSGVGERFGVLNHQRRLGLAYE